MGTVYLELATATSGDYIATIERLADGYYREDDVETFSAALAFSDKDILLTRGVGDLLNTYYTSVIATSWNDGLYKLRFHDLAESSGVVASQVFGVRAGNEVVVGEESYVYHADIIYIHDDTNERDEYTIVWFKNGVRITTGITSPTIQVIDRTDGADLIAAQTVTQIGSTGAYKYNASSAERQTAGEAYLVITSATIDGATRSFTSLLGRDINT